MPSTLLDKYNLIFANSHPDFMKRCQMALFIFGEFMSRREESSPEEKAWGAHVVRDTATWFGKMRTAIIGHPTIANAATVESLSDSDIQGVIESVAPGFVGSE